MSGMAGQPLPIGIRNRGLALLAAAALLPFTCSSLHMVSSRTCAPTTVDSAAVRALARGPPAPSMTSSTRSEPSASITRSALVEKPNAFCQSRARRTISESDSVARTISAILLPSIRVYIGPSSSKVDMPPLAAPALAPPDPPPVRATPVSSEPPHATTSHVDSATAHCLPLRLTRPVASNRTTAASRMITGASMTGILRNDARRAQPPAAWVRKEDIGRGAQSA